MTVYIDVLFAVNFMINSVLIYLTAVITRFEMHIARLATAAAASALYGTVMFFPDIGFMYSTVAKLIFSAVLIIFTFKTYKIFRFLKTVLVFFLVSFIFGGAVFAVIFLTNSGRMLGAVMSNGELYLNLNAGVLFAISACTYIGILMFTKIFRRNYSRDRILKKLIIKAYGEEITVTGLIDTGCELCDPMSGKPAMLIEEAVLSENLRSIICVSSGSGMSLDFAASGSLTIGTSEEDCRVSNSESRIGENDFNAEDLSRGIRYLQFSSVGCESGYIRGFTADSVEICDSELYVSGKITVGLAEFELSDDGLYNAIINPEMLEKREEKETGYAKKLYRFFKS